MSHNLVTVWQGILQDEKKLKQEKEEFRKLVLNEMKKNKQLVPRITIEVPKSYFSLTGQSKDDFLQSRYPDWILEAEDDDDNTVTFTLSKNEEYLSNIYTFDGEDHALAKTVVEYSPEIDTETLMCEDPDLFDRLFEKVTVWELNEEALEQEVATNPDIFATLRRHSKVKTPSIKILVKKVKDE